MLLIPGLGRQKIGSYLGSTEHRLPTWQVKCKVRASENSDILVHWATGLQCFFLPCIFPGHNTYPNTVCHDMIQDTIHVHNNKTCLSPCVLFVGSEVCTADKLSWKMHVFVVCHLEYNTKPCSAWLFLSLCLENHHAKGLIHKRATQQHARLAIQQLFLIQILLPFPIFKLLSNFIFLKATDLNLGSSTYFLPALFISGTHKVPGLKFKGG